MPVLTPGNTVYTRPVAKVLISIPDALLERVDAYAGAKNETRSGFLQRLAERELDLEDQRRGKEIGDLLDSIRIETNGVDPAQLIRESRDSR
jgi:metal-responsive CopG/Arc/MetJ family transcriptional regulator